jgi:fatty acid desaturase
MSILTEERGIHEGEELRRQIMAMRRVHPWRNLVCLAQEYISLAIVIGGAVYFSEVRATWGVSWWWNVPVYFVAMMLIGAIQHRLAGLGHEAAHYTFMKHRVLNDLIPDLFCMFPILTTVHFYRVFHMAHHQFTNDPQRDPDLLNLGHGKRAFEFPMSRGRFITVVYFCMIVAPLRFIRFQLAYLIVNTLGKGRSVYLGTAHERAPSRVYLPSPATFTGLTYILFLDGLYLYLACIDRNEWIFPAGLIGTGLGMAGVFLLPRRFHYRSPLKRPYSIRAAGALRLGYYTIVFMFLAHIRWLTGGRSVIYPLLLWCIPLATSFTFFMFLRDVYQHSNADAGRLTNSRVFFVDRFTRWAVFVYGQDMHIPHHLYPAVPFHRLPELHGLLKQTNPEYESLVTECHGTFRDHLGRTTILDEMTRQRAG